MKTFELYSAGPGGPITNKSAEYSRGGYPWKFRVRANSVAEATALCVKQVVATGDAGVLTVDHRDASGAGWPWKMDINAVADWLR